LSLSCTYCRDFWRDERESFATAFTRLGVSAAVIPYPRLPSDEAALEVLFCAPDPPGAFIRCMDELARRQPRDAAGVLGVAQSVATNACVNRGRAASMVGLNRYFGAHMLGITQLPVIAVGNEVFQGPSGLSAARRRFSAS
jgi:hypothetical protein